MEVMRTKPVGAGGRIAYFFRQTFRHHSGSEFSELLTRGIHEDKGVNRQYPWAYLRVFGVAFILFAVYLLIVRFVSDSAGRLFAPTITVIAAGCVNLPFLLLLYELYPEKDLSFITVCLVMLFGGACAHIVAQILYDIFPVSDPWVKAVITGLFEELPKAAATIVAIIIARKRSPLAGFILGAAVGCGFSVAEDMGYIFLETSSLPVTNLNTIITVSAVRGVSSLCTHALWTAAIGWAYNLFNKWLSNVVFYLMTVLSCGLHIAWDLPLSGVGMGFIYGGCAAVALAYTILIYVFGRRKVYREDYKRELEGSKARSAAEAESAVSQPVTVGGEIAEGYDPMDYSAQSGEDLLDGAEYFEEDGQSLNASNPIYWTYWGRLAIFLGAFIMSVIAVIYCSVSFPEVYGIHRFKSPETLVSFMQEGRDLEVENRPYNGHGGNYSSESETDENGVSRIVRVTQTETVNGITYYYDYSASYDSYTDRYYYFPLSSYAMIKNGEGLNVPRYKENLYDDGVLYATFYHVREDVTNYTFDKDGVVTVYTYNPDFIRDLTEPRYMWLFGPFAAVFGASAVCYVSLKIKSWRIKKLCSTKDVSSAE